MPRSAREDKRDALRHAAVFNNWVTRTIEESGIGMVASESANARIRYCRACVCLAETLLRKAPNVSRLFNGDCADDKGQTHERAALEKVLKARGIKVISWKDAKDKYLKDHAVKPLVFPPSFMSQIHTGGACALLDFAEHHKRSADSR
jgi:hypothetical protein